MKNPFKTFKIKYNELSKWQKRFVIFEIILALLVVQIFYVEIIDVDRTGDPKARTVTTPAVFRTSRDLLVELKVRGAYKDLYESLVIDNNRYHRMYVIPGLNGTKTLNLFNGEIDLCEDMVPQGLTVSKSYIFFTMYCHKGEHNSMLMVLNKNTGEFVKEVPLAGKPHVGGIAYDTDHDIIWISGKKSGKASAIGLSLASVLNYDSKAMKKPIEYTYEVPLDELKANSFMTYKDDCLFVGYFNMRGNGKIHIYHIDQNDGSIVDPKEAASFLNDLGNKLGMEFSDRFATVMPCVQGISFVDDKLIMTQSFGPFNSLLFISDDTDIYSGRNQLLEKKMVGNMTFPSYLEYACYSPDDNKVYFLFEGAAKAYRWRARVPMDRIISVPIE